MSFAVAAAVLGWAGAGLMITGYWLVSTRRVAGSGAVFQVLNVSGSVGLGLAAVSGGVWSAAVLNGIWVAIGVSVLARRRPAADSGAPIVGPGGTAPRRAAHDDQELM